ncbi:MAG: hypothetical protein ABSA05_06550 [Opitutaceae bacterium]
MNSTPPLTGAYLRTYNTIFQHPISHNLEWRTVYSLLEKLGHVSEEPNGNLKVTRNGRTLVLHRSYTKDVAESSELIAVRHFLVQSEEKSAEIDPQKAQWLVVIDHHEARVYRSAARGAIPQQIRPHVPEDFFRHAQDSKEFARGQEKPDPNSFFEPVAGVLNGAGEILIFGTGTGMSSEMDQFIAWLKLSRPELARRIVGSLVIDESHLTEDELLAKARDFYAKAAVS